MSRTIEEISVGTTSGADYREQLRKVHADLDAARSTISEQEKRIAELEAELRTNKLALEMCANECNRLYEDYDKKSDALTSERQRREEGEAVLRIITKDKTTISDYRDGINAAREHFRKYEPIPAEEERGG